MMKRFLNYEKSASCQQLIIKMWWLQSKWTFFWGQPCEFRRNIGIYFIGSLDRASCNLRRKLIQFICSQNWISFVVTIPQILRLFYARRLQVINIRFLSQAKYSRIAIYVSKPWKIRNSELTHQTKIETCSSAGCNLLSSNCQSEYQCLQML